MKTMVELDITQDDRGRDKIQWVNIPGSHPWPAKSSGVKLGAALGKALETQRAHNEEKTFKREDEEPSF